MSKRPCLIHAVLFFLLSGCSSMPLYATGQTEMLAPTSPTARQTQHEIRFGVRAGVQARVYIQETVVMLQLGQAAPVVLESIYPPIYRDFRNQYLKIADYDHDGDNDLAVLQTVGHGGNDRCYAIYRYNASTGQFRSQKSFDRCNI